VIYSGDFGQEDEDSFERGVAATTGYPLTILKALVHSHDFSQEDEDNFSEVLPALHAGAVTGVDVAVRRPLAVTTGADRVVRLWNHVDRCKERLQGVD